MTPWSADAADGASGLELIEVQYGREAVGAAVLFACGGAAIAVGDTLGAWRIPVIAAGFGAGRVLAALLEPGQRLTVNPATSLLSWFSGRIAGVTLLCSIGVHVAAMTAVCAALGVLPGVTATDLLETTTSPQRSVIVIGVLSVVWFAVLVRSPTLPVIGAVYTAVHLIGLPLGGGSLNPARTIAPVLVSWVTTSMWPFLIVPVLVAGVMGVRRRSLARG